MWSSAHSQAQKPIPAAASFGTGAASSAGSHARALFNPWIIVLCQQAGFQPRIEHVNGQPVSVLNLVAAGLGITMQGAQFQRLGIEGVRFVSLAKPVPGYRYCATWQRTNKHPALLNFVETARKTQPRASHG